MTSRVVGFGRSAWNHKKKLVFFGCVGTFGARSVRDWSRDQEIRSDYARRAEIAGRQPVSADYQPLRLLVFIDHEDPERSKNVTSFNKNVLPLLILAGLDVRVEVAKNVEELSTSSRGVDVRNCAGICVVGSRRFAVPHVLNGLFVDAAGDEARTPLAVFDPADRDNVELLCRKTMDIVHGVRRRAHVFSTRFYLKKDDLEETTKTDFRLADLTFGWFDFYRERASKFWIFGGLADRIACTWYLLKHFPQPLCIVVDSTARCSGCRRCVTEAPVDVREASNSQRWWQRWIGRREQPSDRSRREFAHVINPACGIESRVELKALDVSVRRLDEGVYGGLELQTVAPMDSRWSAIWRVWSQWQKKESPANFFGGHVPSQRLNLKIKSELPNVIRESQSLRRLQHSIQDESTPTITRIEFEAGPKTVQLY